MATIEQDHEQDQQTKPNAQKTSAELFRYSAWVHVGRGADACEQAETGACSDPAHFHAWCRLPNQLQHEDIREKALGAKARRARQLRDPEADAYAVLESDMEELTRAAKDDLVNELVMKDWWKRQLDASADVEERDEFNTIAADRERVAELRALEPNDRPHDELDELERHLAAYAEAVDTRRKELDAPVVEALNALTVDELIAQIRGERISAEANQAFMDTYSRWEWIVGTYRNADGHRNSYFTAGINQLREQAPEVIEALRRTYANLEGALQRGPQGN